MDIGTGDGRSGAPLQIQGSGSSPAAAELLQQLLAGVSDYAIFALDGDGRIATWSWGAERITGYPESEAVGTPFSRLGEADGRQNATEALVAARAPGGLQRERWWRRQDGSLVWIDELISPFQDESGAGFIVIARDLSARVEAEERLLAAGTREEEGLTRERALRAELQAAERRAAFLAEASSILVASALNFEATMRSLARLSVSRLGDWCVIQTLTEDGRLHRTEVAHRDPRREKTLERVIDQLAGGAWLDPVHSVLNTGRAQILERLPGALWPQVPEADRKALLPEGEPTSALVAPLLGRGKVLGAMLLIAAECQREFDDHDLELAEELGRRAAIALDNARLYREAQEANRAKADFLAVMSHELRTPLNAIMGYTDLMDAQVSGPLTAKQHGQIGRIRASARHLLQLIEEILSYARMESGGEEVRIAVADAGSLVEAAAAVVEPLAHAKGIGFEIDVHDRHVSIETDGAKVRQVLVNLLSNAVKFTDDGVVGIRFLRDGEEGVFEVHDTGIGIPEDQHRRIFDPFWQVARPNIRRVGGTGLGLSVSRRFARLLRGDLTFESQPGIGSTFRLRLPLELDPGRRQKPQA
ncbi:MAG TPA: ATP-binding protein [Longimicrobiales bacterium]|nr:ATP-binding protein [Longimicrobiales bacterium]